MIAVDVPPRQVAHRPTDAVRAVVAAIVLALTGASIARGNVDLASWQQFVEGIPPWIAQGCVAVVVIAFAVALLVSVASISRLRSDPWFVRDVIVVFVITVTGAYLVSFIVVVARALKPAPWIRPDPISWPFPILSSR